MSQPEKIQPYDQASRQGESLLPPGSWLGLLGGGQLGRMFCMAAQSMGYKVCVLDPAQDGPSAAVADRHIQADFIDPVALQQLADLCTACTTEFENVPSQALDFLSKHCIVAPRANAVSIAQDRSAEKEFAVSCGLDCAPYCAIASVDDVDSLDTKLLPGILKVSRLGYDGKGQARVGSVQEVREAFERFDSVPCVLEKKLSLATELSVVVARGRDGEVVSYPVSENVHINGILATSTVPAQVNSALAQKATEATVKMAQALDYAGILCVEFFVLDDGRLIVNEMAPRPHNSGHYSIDACHTSQFEQQARVLAGWPLGSVEQLLPAVMLNLLGDCWFTGHSGNAVNQECAIEPPWLKVVSHPMAKLHLYGKRDPRPARKMGHVTVLADSTKQAHQVIRQIRLDLGI
ncbi:MAG: 5-(carboxyamino)imidazole ribonucleotide synthase [Burkholderiaceae bacterium]